MVLSIQQLKVAFKLKEDLLWRCRRSWMAKVLITSAVATATGFFCCDAFKRQNSCKMNMERSIQYMNLVQFLHHSAAHLLVFMRYITTQHKLHTIHSSRVQHPQLGTAHSTAQWLLQVIAC